ncbi:hypothetical protein MRX96_003660 [Rhipicephalus microplus]
MALPWLQRERKRRAGGWCGCLSPRARAAESLKTQTWRSSHCEKPRPRRRRRFPSSSRVTLGREVWLLSRTIGDARSEFRIAASSIYGVNPKPPADDLCGTWRALLVRVYFTEERRFSLAGVTCEWRWTPQLIVGRLSWARVWHAFGLYTGAVQLQKQQRRRQPARSAASRTVIHYSRTQPASSVGQRNAGVREKPMEQVECTRATEIACRAPETNERSHNQPPSAAAGRRGRFERY